MKNFKIISLIALMLALSGLAKPVSGQEFEQKGVPVNYALENIPTDYRSWDVHFFIGLPSVSVRDQWVNRVNSGTPFNSFYVIEREREYRGTIYLTAILSINGVAHYKGRVERTGYWSLWIDQAPIVIDRWERLN